MAAKKKTPDAWSQLGLRKPKPVESSKLPELLGKLRKGADASLTMAQAVAVAEALGWTVEPVAHVAPAKDHGSQPHTISESFLHGREPSPDLDVDGGETAAEAESRRAWMAGRALPSRPEQLPIGETAIYGVSSIHTYADGRSHFTYGEVVGVAALRFTDTRGNTQIFWPSGQYRRYGKTVISMPSFDFVRWAKSASSWLDDINRFLGTEAHAPAEKRTREGTGTCWDCWRNIKMDPSGRMVHHGFQRPGDGQIHGDCMGVGTVPYEVSREAGEVALAGWKKSLNHQLSMVAAFKSGEITEIKIAGLTWRSPDKTCKPSGDAGWQTRDEGDVRWMNNLAWQDLVNAKVKVHEQAADEAEREVRLYEHAVETWRVRPLPTNKDLEFEHLWRLQKELAEKMKARKENPVRNRRQNPLPSELEEGGFEAKVQSAAIRLQAGQTEEEVEADLVLNHGVDGPMAMLITRAARVLMSEWEPRSERDTKPDMRAVVKAAGSPVTRSGEASRVLLGPTDDQVLQAIDSHAGAFVDMAPVDFLRLTTTDEDHIRKVQSEAHDLAKYEKHMAEGKCEIHPFLRIDTQSGRVVGHDGRHRAAAILSADPDATMRVALIPVPLSKTASMADIPETVKGEYDPGFRLKIRSNVTVVDDNVQQGCSSCGEPASKPPQEKKSLFQDTVLRRDAKGQLFLMNRPEKGWASYGIPYPSEQAVLDEWNVTIGPWTKDRFSAYAPVRKARKGNPVGGETFYVTRVVTDSSGTRVSHGYAKWSGANGGDRYAGPVEINLSLDAATHLAKRLAREEQESMAPPGRYVVSRTGGSTAGMTSEEMDEDARNRVVASFPVKIVPIAKFRNDDTGMESYVNRGSKPGTFNVTMRDLDSGEWVPGARIGIASLDQAKTLARKWAGVGEE